MRAVHHVAVTVDETLKTGSIAESCRRAHVSGGLLHRRPKTIVDQVPPASIRAAARDIACRAFDVHVLAVGTCAINRPVHHDLGDIAVNEYMAALASSGRPRLRSRSSSAAISARSVTVRPSSAMSTAPSYKVTLPAPP